MRLLIRDLQPNTDYGIEVRAVNDTTSSQWSRIFVIHTINDNTIPNPPGSFAWTYAGGSFNGSWTKPTTNVDGSTINDFRYFEVKLESGVTTKYIYTVDTSFSLSYDDNKAMFGTPAASITASVRVVDSFDNVSAWAGPITATAPTPNPPTNAVVTPGTDSIGLKWDASTSTDVVSYRVYVGTTAGFTPSAANKVFDGMATSFSYVTTTYSTHYFKISAVSKLGLESTYLTASGDPVSPFGGDSTAPTAPTSVTASISTVDSTQATSALVSWVKTSPETDLAGYLVRYRVTGQTDWESQDVPTDSLTNQTSVVISRLQPYTAYDFQVSAYDSSANYSTFVATVPTSTPGATNSAPSTPTAPTVAANTLQIQVIVPGTKASGGAMEADVVFYEVYASTTSGFTPASANMLGTIPVGPAMVETFDIPANAASGTTQTWFSKIIAVDRGGLKSAASAASSGANVNLIASANIADLAVTNAKINDLAANKITAGTGLINDLTVKAILTLGDASTDGVIQSFDYVGGGTTGYRMTKNSLTINNGSIAARALQLQRGQNLIPPAFADFEFSASHYTSNLSLSAGTATTDATDKRIGNQSLKWVPTAGATVTFAPSTTTYNIPVQVAPAATVDYIISFFAMVKTGATATTITPSVRYATSGAPGTLNGSGQAIAANSTWARYSTTVTLPATTPVGSANLFFTSSAATTVYIDGVQVEEKLGGVSTPSAWSPSSTTTIDGGMIRTGSIVSDATTTINGNTVPVWSIPLNGSATFANLKVRGNTVLGLPDGSGGDTDAGLSTLSSANYVKSLTGWQIRSDGFADFIGIGSDAINGKSIVAGTLDVGTIKNSTMNAEIMLEGNFVAGTKGQAAVEFGKAGMFVYDWDSVNLKRSPTVSFPATGGINIIGGSLNANVLNVSGATSFGTTTKLERGTQFTLGNKVSTPIAAPILESFLDRRVQNPQSLDALGGHYDSASARTYVVTSTPSGSYTMQAIMSIDPTNATVTSTPVNFAMMDIKFISVTRLGAYYYVVTRASNGADNYYNYYTYVLNKYDATTGALASSVTIHSASVPTGANPDTNYATQAQIANDGTDLWVATLTNASGIKPVFKRYSTALTGTVLQTVSPTTVYGTTTGLYTLASFMVGNFDYGSQRFIIGLKVGNSVNIGVWNSTPTLQAGFNWPISMGTYPSLQWNSSISKFQGLSDLGNSSTPFGVFDFTSLTTASGAAGESYNAVSTYRQTSGGYETAASPIGTTIINARWKFRITASKSASDETGFYMKAATAGTYYRQGYVVGGTSPSIEGSTILAVNALSPVPFPDATAAKIMSEEEFDTTLTLINITSGSATVVSTGTDQPFKWYTVGAKLAHANFPNGVTTITAVNVDGTQATVSPAPTGSTTGATVALRDSSVRILGDGTAKFKAPVMNRMIVDSATDATTSAGNEPALRVGNIFGGHLRIDGNELLAMENDTTQGTFYVNRDGPVEIRGMVKVGIRNSGTLVANTDKTLSVAFNQAFPSSGPVPVVTATTTGTTRNGDPAVSVNNITRTGFDIVYKRGNTTAIDAQWIAIATVAN